MVEMDLIAASHVHIVRFCGEAHCTVIFAIAQLSWFSVVAVSRLHHSVNKYLRKCIKLTILI